MYFRTDETEKEMKIYTKTGDKGMTSLIGGTRVAKNSVRLEAYGTVDELNSYLGLIRSYATEETIAKELAGIQSVLFEVGGHLATDTAAIAPTKRLEVGDDKTTALEKAIDRMDAELPPLHSFVLPGGDKAASVCHIARTVCRRAERRILDVCQSYEVDESVVKYINRLSDYLFVLARKLAHDNGTEELKWPLEGQN